MNKVKIRSRFYLTNCIVLTSIVMTTCFSNAQTISGNLSLLTKQTIKLEGLKIYTIAKTTIDEKGKIIEGSCSK
jgi:hypothetical protein